MTAHPMGDDDLLDIPPLFRVGSPENIEAKAVGAAKRAEQRAAEVVTPPPPVAEQAAPRVKVRVKEQMALDIRQAINKDANVDTWGKLVIHFPQVEEPVLRGGLRYALKQKWLKQTGRRYWVP